MNRPNMTDDKKQSDRTGYIHIVSTINVRSGMKILDIGCGLIKL